MKTCRQTWTNISHEEWWSCVECDKHFWIRKGCKQTCTYTYTSSVYIYIHIYISWRTDGFFALFLSTKVTKESAKRGLSFHGLQVCSSSVFLMAFMKEQNITHDDVSDVPHWFFQMSFFDVFGWVHTLRCWLHFLIVHPNLGNWFISSTMFLPHFSRPKWVWVRLRWTA